MVSLEGLGGCCVCSDERGWDENPLVYCDGHSCNVAVHQACYGIVTVPSGPWFCRKCESTERSARVRCELCPSRDGAFKKTDNNSWAHVVCALYIPEVRFQNVTTMEPILISLIPQERYNKTCYICEERGDKKESKASMGACMQCNKPGCKQHFHVTCAQLLGLLCEEAGNMMDNVKYCGYCQYHYSKLKKTSNMKIIPPFKPTPNITESPTSSPEKLTPKPSTPIASPPTILGDVQGQTCQNIGENTFSSDTSSLKPLLISKGSSKKMSGNGKASSVSSSGSNGSNNSNNTNTNPSPMPRIQIQPSNLFGSCGGGFSSTVLSSTSSSNGNGINQSAERKLSRSKSGSPVADESGVIKLSEKNTNGKGLKSIGGKSNDEDSNSKADESPKSEQQRNKSFDVGSSSFMTSTFGLNKSNIKEMATVSMKDLISTTVDKKYDRSSSTSSLTGGIPEPSFTNSNSNSTSGTRILDKPPPDIKPHVTLTPIPMKSEENKMDRTSRSKSPGGFPSAFGQSGKLLTGEPMDTDMATLEKSTGSPGKRMRGTSREEDNRGKGPGGKRGRRGSFTNTAPFNRRESTANGNGGLILDDNVGDISKLDEIDGVNGLSGGSRGGRHAGLSRKGSAPVPITTPISLVQNTPSPVVRPKPNYEDTPTPTLSQIKAQMAAAAAASSTASTPEKSSSLAPHMFGNALNPASSMAQRMVDSLSKEMETIAAAGSGPLDTTVVPIAPIVGISFPGKSSNNSSSSTSSFGLSVPKGNGSTNNVSIPKVQPQTLEELLERQWEQGSQFLMEQAQHLDISQLLSCLNQLKQDNKALEDHVQSLCQRKEQLTAINARLSIPLGSTNSLGLGLTFGNNSVGRQETSTIQQQVSKPPIPPPPPPIPHQQLHQHIQQEVQAHQGRQQHPSHKFPGFEPGGHGYPQQQQHHRGSGSSSGTASSSQMYGFVGQGQGGVGTSHPSSHNSGNPHHPHQSRDSR